MTWIQEIYRDEIRNGVLVTTDRKKIWNVEMELLDFLKNLCQKHGIRYFAMYGTLIGTIRHRGFIPWDDDIDVGMLRPDYNRFVRIAREEIEEPYFLQNMYSDRMIQFSKIRDSRTTAVEFSDWPMNQGIFIDIFPLDTAPDGSMEMERVYAVQRELWMAVRAPEDVESGLAQGATTQSGEDVLRRMIAMPTKERMAIFESFMELCSDKSSQVGLFSSFMRGGGSSWKRAWFESVEELPFELSTISVPIGYEDFLHSHYGEYSLMKRVANEHAGAVFSADIPYTEYLEQIKEL